MSAISGVRRCPNCGTYIKKIGKWTLCPHCHRIIHFKIKVKNGKIKRAVLQPQKQ